MRPPPRGVLEASRGILRRGATHRPLPRLAAALLLLQLAWVLAIPPFAGVDEFDHTYRAAAVASGQWQAPASEATRGTGAMVEVPRHIVEAARPECERLPYTKAADCDPRSEADVVEMASGAGRYNPLFYALVGTPASAFEGTTAHYVMRLTNVLLCFALVAAAWVVARRLASPLREWLALGITLALTPVALFSMAMVAPNGLEIAAGIAFWVAGLALLTRPEHASRPDAATVVLFAVAGVLLLQLRSLGPVWFGLVVLLCLVATRPSGATLRRLLWGSGRMLLANAALLLSALGALAWTLSQDSLRVGIEKVDPIGAGALAGLVAKANIVWVFQSIAAFPTRVNLAPAPVYVAGLVLLIGLLTAAHRAGAGPARRAMWLTVLAALVVPSVITYRTYDSFGIAWQGRYTLPLSCGVMLLGALALARARREVRADLGVVGLAAYVVMQTLGPAAAMSNERSLSPGVDNGAWLLLPTPVVALLFAVGSGLLWLTAVAPLVASPDREPVTVADDG